MNSYRFIKSSCIALAASLVLVGCGGGGSGSSSTTDQKSTNETKTAYLIDAAVAGVKYVNADGSTGYTNADGSFDYTGGVARFYVGNVQIGEISSLQSDLKVFVQDVVGVDRTNINHPDVLKVATFLQSIDDDGNPDNGIQTRNAHSDFESISNVNIKDSSANVNTLLTNAGKPVKSEAEVKAHLSKELDNHGVKADIEAPRMISSNINGEVDINNNILVKFSEPLLAETLIKSNIILKQKSNSYVISCSLSFDRGSNTLIINPNNSLDAGEDYVLNISRDVHDIASNALESEVVLNFTTKAVSDNIKPTVTLQSASTDIALDSNIEIKFSEDMKTDTITSTNILLLDEGNNVINTDVTYNEVSRLATINPNENLKASTTYTVKIKDTVKDKSGDSIDAISIDVQTASVALANPPQIKSISLDSNSVLAQNDKIKITFSKEVKETTLADNIKIRKDGKTFDITTIITLNGALVTIEPKTPLDKGANYTLTIKNGIEDTLGNKLDISADKTYAFSVEKEIDNDRPFIDESKSNITNNAINVAIDANFKFTFDEDMDVSSFADNNITLELEGGANIAKSVSYLNKVVTITPDANLSYSSSYILKLTHGIKDLAGNEFDGKPGLAGLDDYVVSFTTIADPSDNTAPVLQGSNNLGTITKDAKIILSFNEELKEINNGNYQTYLNIPYGYHFEKYENKKIYFRAASNSYNTDYTIVLKDTISDLAGNTLSTPISVTFKTQTEPDTTAPKVKKSVPAEKGTLGGLSTPIVIEFTEALNSDSVNASNILLVKTTDEDTNLISNSDIALADTNVTITPASPLIDKAEYKVIIKKDGVKDLEGNKFEGAELLDADYSFTFTVSASSSSCGSGYTKHNNKCLKVDTSSKIKKDAISCTLATKDDLGSDEDAYVSALSLATDGTKYFYQDGNSIKKMSKNMFGWTNDLAYSTDEAYSICKEN